MAFVSEPVGLQNGAKNVCFFNSDLQLLFSLSYFRDIALRYRSFSNDADPFSTVRHLFQIMLGQNRAIPVVTDPHILQLGLPGYIRGTQFDAQECLSHIINLFLSVVHDRENYQYLSCLREGDIQVQDSIS